MSPGDALGHVEFAVLDAVNRGALRSRRRARQVHSLSRCPAGDAILHDALRRCERDGLLRSARDGSGRRYALTPSGRKRLRAERNFRRALALALIRTGM
jgi:DNA-binding PadR family transcriptional regulator